MWYEGNLGHAHGGFYMAVEVQKHEVGRSLERRPLQTRPKRGVHGLATRDGANIYFLFHLNSSLSRRVNIGLYRCRSQLVIQFLFTLLGLKDFE